MATVIEPNGKEHEVPPHFNRFTLEEACHILDCDRVDEIPLYRGRSRSATMFVDENFFK